MSPSERAWFELALKIRWTLESGLVPALTPDEETLQQRVPVTRALFPLGTGTGIPWDLKG